MLPDRCEELTLVDSEKDLGLITSKYISWGENIYASIKAANKTIGWITRNTLQIDPKIICHIYKTIVRPK